MRTASNMAQAQRTFRSLSDQWQQDQPPSCKEFIEALQEWIRLRWKIIRQLEKIIKELENAKNKTNIAELSASVLGLLSVGVQISCKLNLSSSDILYFSKMFRNSAPVCRQINTM